MDAIKLYEELGPVPKIRSSGVGYATVPSLVHYFPCNEGSTSDNNIDTDIIGGHTYNKLNDAVGDVILSKDHTYLEILTNPPVTFTWHGNDALNPSPIGSVRDFISVNFSPNDQYTYPFVGDWNDIGTDSFIAVLHWSTNTDLSFGIRFGDSDTNSHIHLSGDGSGLRDTSGNEVHTASHSRASVSNGMIIALDRSDDTFYSVGFDSKFNAEVLSTSATTIGAITPTAGISASNNTAKETAGLAIFKMTELPVDWLASTARMMYQWNLGNRTFPANMEEW